MASYTNGFQTDESKYANVENVFIRKAKTGRKDVIFEIYGFGEDVSLPPFDNKYPEERFYNRTVIIDIIPKK